MRRFFVLFALLLPLTMLAQKDDWSGGGYAELQDQTPKENFLKTPHNNKYWVASLGAYQTTLSDEPNPTVYIGHGRNIARHKLPLYLEYGIRYAYGEGGAFGCTYDGSDWWNKYDRSHLFGLVINFSYKFQYKKFKLSPVLGPTVVWTPSTCYDWDELGATFDLGFRLGYKVVNIDYRHCFDMVRANHTADMVTLSFTF